MPKYLERYLPENYILTDNKGNTYRVIRFLAAGGMACTYHVKRESDNKDFALKECFIKKICARDKSSYNVIATTAKSEETFKKYKLKFRKEPALLKLIGESRHIVKIESSSFEANNTVYYVMDLINGSDLKSQQETLSVKQCVTYITQIAGAIKQVHAQRVLHLDIKPNNIMIKRDENGGDDYAILIDFGSATEFDSEGNQIQNGMTTTKNEFTPIEQIGGGVNLRFNPSTDIFTLGGTLCRILSKEQSNGEYSFRNNIPHNIKIAIQESQKDSIDERPQTIDEFLHILKTGKKLETQHKSDDSTELFQESVSKTKKVDLKGAINSSIAMLKRILPSIISLHKLLSTLLVWAYTLLPMGLLALLFIRFFNGSLTLFDGGNMMIIVALYILYPIKIDPTKRDVSLKDIYINTVLRSGNTLERGSIFLYLIMGVLLCYGLLFENNVAAAIAISFVVFVCGFFSIFDLIKYISSKPRANLKNRFRIATLLIWIAYIYWGGKPPIYQDYQDDGIQFMNFCEYKGEVIPCIWGYRGVAHGQGEVIYTDGTREDSNWQYGRPLTQIRLFDSKGHLQSIKFDKQTIKYSDGEYIGQLYTLKNRQIRDGIGEYHWNSGDRYEGEWVKNSMSGDGTLYFKNGDIYKGEFLNNLRNGKGVLTLTTGDRYEGEFSNDKFHSGVYIYDNEDRYYGQWNKGKRSGLGFVVSKANEITEQNWSDDVCIKSAPKSIEQILYAVERTITIKQSEHHGYINDSEEILRLDVVLIVQPNNKKAKSMRQHFENN